MTNFKHVTKKIFNPATKSLETAYLKSLFLWNPLIIFFFCLLEGNLNSLPHRYAVSLLIGGLVSNFCFGLTFIARSLDRHLALRKGLPPPVRPRAWWFSVSAMGMAPGLYLAFKVMILVGPLFGWPPTTIKLEDYRFGLLLGGMIAGIFFLIQTRAEARTEAKTSELKLKKMENERLQAQISALTAQMNPHLLFNALNTVASLVNTEPQKAEDVIVKLSELYRGVLDSSRNLTHPLETEIGICKSYLAIEHARFGERLKSSIEISPDINSKLMMIPALSLQPLIENAVKHGLSPRASGGEVRIIVKTENEKVKIFVQDNGVGFNSSKGSQLKKNGAGIGIKNCQERFKLHFGEASDFNISEKTGGGTIIALTLPMTQAAPVVS